MNSTPSNEKKQAGISETGNLKKIHEEHLRMPLERTEAGGNQKANPGVSPFQGKDVQKVKPSKGDCPKASAAEPGDSDGGTKLIPRQQRRRNERDAAKEADRLKRREELIVGFLNSARQDWSKAGFTKAEIADKSTELTGKLTEALDRSMGCLCGKTWKDFEKGKTFSQNDKIVFVKKTVPTLIAGIDIGKENVFVRYYDTDAIEVSSKKCYSFDNSYMGHQDIADQMTMIAAKEGKEQIVAGIEPTGHYWFNLYSDLINRGITVVMVNPYAVKTSKELDDNMQDKSDRKDPRVIAKLVVDGRFSMPYIPEGIYDTLRTLCDLEYTVGVQRTAWMNRMTAWADVHFPGLETVLKWDSVTGRLVLREAPLPEDILRIGVEGLVKIFRANKLRGVGEATAKKIYAAAENAHPNTSSLESARYEAKTIIQYLDAFDENLKEIQERKEAATKSIPWFTEVDSIKGIGADSLSNFLGALGDISRFNSPSQIIKILGLVPADNDSGTYTGRHRISKRGRKRARYYAVLMARNVAIHSPEWQAVYTKFTTRAENPYKPNQAYIAVAAKLIRVIFKLIQGNGTVKYDGNMILRALEEDTARKKQAREEAESKSQDSRHASGKQAYTA